jgi:integrase
VVPVLPRPPDLCAVTGCPARGGRPGQLARRGHRGALPDYLAYWLREVIVEPDYAPLTCATYETLTRLYIVPGLGGKRLDKLTLRDVRAWLNKLRDTCQCCAQGKDARRPENRRRCCAMTPPACCRQLASDRTIRDASTILCSALTNAVTEELIPKNVAGLLHVSKPRKRKVKPWTADEARQFLESAKRDRDPLYAAYVLILVLGLRKGEAIGLPWTAVNLDGAELDIGWQLQRVGGKLLHRATKTEASDATLPLPGICVTALRMREKDQAETRAALAPRSPTPRPCKRSSASASSSIRSRCCTLQPYGVEKGHCPDRGVALTWVGVGRFELPASSSRSNSGASGLVCLSRTESLSPAQTRQASRGESGPV